MTADDDPVRLDAALALLFAHPDDATEAFGAEWQRWGDDHGRPPVLPAVWRSQIGELVALGLSAEQAEWCVAKAMTAELRNEAAVFAYARAVARDVVKRSHEARARSVDTDAPQGDFIVNTANGVVHLPTCAVVVRCSPLNVTRVTTTVGARRCRVCLGGAAPSGGGERADRQAQ